jgi:hypothetical protein
MAFNALAALRQAGNPVDLLTDREQAIFAQLSEDEVGFLISLRGRLDDVSDSEVEAHSSIKIV